MSDPALCQDRVAISNRFSLSSKLSFINTFPQMVDGILFILISHFLSINEKQFLNQAFFFGLNYDFDKEFQNANLE